MILFMFSNLYYCLLRILEFSGYPEPINYIRTKISFALLRSSILCTRGCRSLRKVQFIDNSIREFNSGSNSGGSIPIPSNSISIPIPGEIKIQF